MAPIWASILLLLLTSSEREIKLIRPLEDVPQMSPAVGPICAPFASRVLDMDGWSPHFPYYPLPKWPVTLPKCPDHDLYPNISMDCLNDHNAAPWWSLDDLLHDPVDEALLYILQWSSLYEPRRSPSAPSLCTITCYHRYSTSYSLTSEDGGQDGMPVLSNCINTSASLLLLLHAE